MNTCVLKKWEDLIYSLANIVNARKITGDLVSRELSEILPDLSEFKRELQEVSAEKWLNILENAEKHPRRSILRRR